MKTTRRWSLLVLLVLPATVEAQNPEIQFAGSHPPDTAAISVALQYAEASMAPWETVEERDERRAALVSDGYFYHGVDGSPIGFEGLTARQTRNGLRIDAVDTYDAIFHQYENTAVVTYKMRQSGQDRGQPFENRSSGIIVLTKTADGWRVVSDIIGHDPPSGTPRR